MSTVRMCIMVCVLGIGLAGCVGSPLHSTMTYNSIQSTIKKNNENLMALQVGTSQPEV